MKILVLHGIDSVAQVRRTSLHHAFFLTKHAPGHDYWLQAVHAPLSDEIIKTNFDVIVIETTFLCQRWTEPVGIGPATIKRKFHFLRESSAVKIAFPQDEPDHAQILDEWLADWKVDVIYSLYYKWRNEFYRRSGAHAEIRFGLAGMVEPEDTALVARYAVPWNARAIDVGYRARRLGANFGWFSQLKSDIGERFKAAAAGKRLALDISCDPADAIAGDGWLRFLGQCRFVLGCESGQSVLDPVGGIKRRCDQYVLDHPGAEFTEIAHECLRGVDRKIPFTCISPRHFEAAAAGCVQILVPGDYAGALKPWEHYIPLAPDASNIDEIVQAMRDMDRMRLIVRASQAALLENPRFSYAAYTEDVLQAVKHRRPNLPDVEQIAPIDGILRLALQTGERWAAAWPRWWRDD